MIVVHHAAEPIPRENGQLCAGCGKKLDEFAFAETGAAFFETGVRVALRYADEKAFIAGARPLAVFELPDARALVGAEIYCSRLARMMQR